MDTFKYEIIHIYHKTIIKIITTRFSCMKYHPISKSSLDTIHYNTSHKFDLTNITSHKLRRASAVL